MRIVTLLAATFLLISSAAAAEDAWERLRNATANELCWDTARGFAREKYPTVKLGDAALTEITYRAPSPIKESRKAFPGIRTC